ncbi:MAG TPA: bifunctional phosphoribosylaminoimidazolecarboxamide formyltransferase/IMP cyclohydrolase, partial [Candidatus Eisenbacteria bacterium]|nr:bifunctional phosphoribosylaminoimidazolecarboxamide formyltransferase/IMP cyclohydrolase [Candidatus Eisenbacteria bacterium]
IGGPAMLRSAAKNHASVTVVTDPRDYDEVAAQIRANGNTTLALRQKLAARVYARTSEYDAAIAVHLGKSFDSAGVPASTCSADPSATHPGKLKLELQPGTAVEMPAALHLNAERSQTLRYGENPHQRAALYGPFRDYFEQLHGKELSYNNILDLTAAANLIAEFSGERPTLAILKHTNPCGVGQGNNLREAWDKAFATDQQAPFGGIIAVNATVDLGCAQAIAEIFSEVIIAPEFTADALALLQKKKNLRLLRMRKDPRAAPGLEIRTVGAELYLAQERDLKTITENDLKVVTRRQPTSSEAQAMLFGWRVMKHVKSNAIVYAAADRTLGIGAGQMSRVDSSRIAIWKAGEAKLSLQGCAVCSDAFFPFPDGLIAAAKAGATAAIQPGGSVRDADVIAAADAHEVAMAFTGVRHFRH